MEKRSENMTKLIELKGINKTYKNGDQELRVLKDIDLEVEEGEFVAIMGPFLFRRQIMVLLLQTLPLARKS